jgi:hypothetical protein
MTEEKPKGARSKSKDDKSSKTSKKLKKSQGADNEEEEKMKPPHTLSPYIFYSTEAIPKFRAERNCTHQEAMKLAGAGWKELSEKDKAPFIAKSSLDKARYEEQMKMF